MSASDAFTFISYGAILQKIVVDNKNIVLGFNDPKEYLTNPAYFGATIGRVANRISDASIKLLNDKTYPLATNNGPCTLHGGIVGWDKCVFSGPEVVKRKSDGKETQVFELSSPHMDEGFPGEVVCRVGYTPYKVTEIEGGKEVVKEVLEIEYEARLAKEQPEEVRETVVNLTNHSYFNIGGKELIDGTVVTLSTSKHLEVDQYDIPTGTISDFPGIAANKPFTLGLTEPDIDHCFIQQLDISSIPLDTRSLPLYTAAKFSHPDTGINLEVATTEPTFQFYTGKHIDVAAREDGSPRRVARSGFCVEPGRYVNAINVEEWKKMVTVKKGEVFGARIVYKVWKA